MLLVHYYRADDEAFNATVDEVVGTDASTRLVWALVAVAHDYACLVHGPDAEATLGAYALALAAAEAADAQ